MVNLVGGFEPVKKHCHSIGAYRVVKMKIEKRFV